jgi:hypothetical protein
LHRSFCFPFVRSKLDDMDAVTFIEHRGKRILLVDLRSAEAPEAVRRLYEASAVTTREPLRSVLRLVDVTGVGLDARRGEVVHETVVRDLPHLRAIAVVGVEGKKRLVFNVAAAVLGDAIEHFDTLEQAKDWLVTR